MRLDSVVSAKAAHSVISAAASTSSFRRRPESILLLSFLFCVARFRENRAFVPVGLRPPSLAGESLSLLAQRK
jgi:hypothetical protein